jgi:hypothetical protein
MSEYFVEATDTSTFVSVADTEEEVKVTDDSNYVVTEDIIYNLYDVMLVELLGATGELATGTVIGNTEFPITSEISGLDLVDVVVYITPSGVVSTGGNVEFQVVRYRDGVSVDMLSSNLTILEGASLSSAASIDTDNDDVLSGDYIYVDCEADGTSVAGPLWIKLSFR